MLTAIVLDTANMFTVLQLLSIEPPKAIVFVSVNLLENQPLPMLNSSSNIEFRLRLHICVCMCVCRCTMHPKTWPQLESLALQASSMAASTFGRHIQKKILHPCLSWTLTKLTMSHRQMVVQWFVPTITALMLLSRLSTIKYLSTEPWLSLVV